MHAIETVPYKSGTISFYQDEDAQDPRVECDNVSTMLCKHPRYILGDRRRGDPEPTAEEMLAITRKKNVVYVNLYLLDHSGLRLSCHASQVQAYGGWDTSHVGIAYITIGRLRKEYGRKLSRADLRKKGMEILQAEVETYDQYLSGQVYGYIARNAAGDHVGSCWGIYGWDYLTADMLEEARAELDTAEADTQEALSTCPI